MNANQLYKMGKKKTCFSMRIFTSFLGYDFENKDELWGVEEEVEKKVEIKNIVDYCFDGRRTWELNTIWFDGEPIGVQQNAGREGDDHEDRGITNEEKYREMVDWLNFLIVKELKVDDIIEADKHYDGLTQFYGYILEDFIKEGYEPKYKNGDEVEVTISYSDNTKYKAIVVSQKSCEADCILVELHDLYSHKNSLWSFSSNKKLEEIPKEEIEDYKRKLVTVDGNLEYTYR